MADNHNLAGTFIPNKEEKTKFETIVHNEKMARCTKIFDQYVHYKGGTMFFNTMYYILLKSEANSAVVVIGCDMIYNKNGDTFYSNMEGSKAKNDPIIRYGEKGLEIEINNCKTLFEAKNIKLYNASTLTSRLTFNRFDIHLQNSF